MFSVIAVFFIVVIELVVIKFFLVVVIIIGLMQIIGVNEPLRSYLLGGDNALKNVASHALDAATEVFRCLPNCYESWIVHSTILTTSFVSKAFQKSRCFVASASAARITPTFHRNLLRIFNGFSVEFSATTNSRRWAVNARSLL